MSEEWNDGDCRICGQRDELRDVLDYGTIPISDILLTRDQLEDPPVVFPMKLVFCERCAMLQLDRTAPIDVLYGGDYLYYSSQSPMLVNHYGDSAREIIRRFELDGNNLVVELASNDGYMLRSFKEKGVKVLGIDPAAGPAAKAQESGIPTVVDYFSKALADRLVADGIRADVITANNLLSLIPRPGDAIAGIAKLLSDDGHVVIEGTNMINIIAKCEFDMVYHSNFCYFSLSSLDRMFQRHGLWINDVQTNDFFGGSLRIFAEKQQRPSESVRAMLREEQRMGVDKLGFYENFAKQVSETKARILELISGLHGQGKQVAVYGAAGGMATTLLNYVGLDKRLISLAVDNNPKKRGLFMPVNHLMIEGPERLLEKMPDYTLLLSWNYLSEVLEQQSEYRRRGGKFIVPIPRLEVV